MLFLLPSELGFLRYLKHAKVPLNEYQFPSHKIAKIQPQLEKLIESNYYLNKSAKDGYRSYIQAYASHSLKQIFEVSSLDLQKVARAFGFKVPPHVNITIGASGRNDRKQRKQGSSMGAGYSNKKKMEGKEHFFKQRGAVAEFGGRKGGDGRQWSR